VSADVTPSDRAGAFVRFGMKPIRAASIVLVDAAEAPLALGSTVHIEGKPDTGALIGFDGVVYLDALDMTQTLRVVTPTGPCLARVDYPAVTNSIPQIGPLICR
jgi:outer membrane usher protein